VVGTRLSLDFYNANQKVAIEVQGAQHTKFVKHFHKDNKLNFLDQCRRDRQKEDFCEANNIILVKIYDDDEVDKALFRQYDVKL